MSLPAAVVDARRAWRGPRCSRCGQQVFRSPHTGVIYAGQDIHECEVPPAEVEEWKAAWAEAARLLTEPVAREAVAAKEKP